MKILREPASLVLAFIPLTALALGFLSPFLRGEFALDYALMAFYALVQTFLIFLWYRLDAQKRGFRRSRLLNTGVAAWSTLAISYYLFRSRGFRGGLMAMGLSFLLFLRAFLSTVLGVAGGVYLTQGGGAETVPVAVTTAQLNASQILPAAVGLNQQVELLLSKNVRYPPEAWRSGHQGTARVIVYFARGGEISRAELVQSAGAPDLDAEAVAVWARLKAKGVKLQVPQDLSPGQDELAFELPVDFSLN